MDLYASIEEIETNSDINYLEWNTKNPAVLRGHARDQKALKKWNPDFLEQLYGHHDTQLCVLEGNLHPTKFIEVTVREAIHKVINSTTDSTKFYLVSDQFKALSTDLNFPRLLRSGIKYEENFWLSQKKTFSILHFDGRHNFHVMIQGRKEFVLFAPSDTDFLYPFHSNDLLPNNYSRIRSSQQVDLTQFPEFKNSRPYKVALEPGDILFIPAGWWHEVSSLDQCISYNYWWLCKPNDCPVGMILRDFLVGYIGTARIFDLPKNILNLEDFKNHLELALFFKGSGEYWLAILFLYQAYLEHLFELTGHIASNDIQKDPLAYILKISTQLEQSQYYNQKIGNLLKSAIKVALKQENEYFSKQDIDNIFNIILEDRGLLQKLTNQHYCRE